MSEVYDRYVDTAGNYHYADVETGHHVIPNTAVGNFPPPQIIQTNADRIRSMTDEELLEFLYWEADGSGKTPEQWISWLKQEVKQ